MVEDKEYLQDLVRAITQQREAALSALANANAELQRAKRILEQKDARIKELEGDIEPAKRFRSLNDGYEHVQ